MGDTAVKQGQACLTLINSLNFWVIGFIRHISCLRRTIPVAVQDIAVLAGGTSRLQAAAHWDHSVTPFQWAGAAVVG